MKVNIKVYLKQDTELKTFFYNDDSKFKDHETELCKAGLRFIVSGYVQDKTNILLSERPLDMSGCSVVLKDESSLEVFRVSESLLNSNFEEIKLN